VTLIVDQASVREYMGLNTPPSSSQYSDGTIGSNILMAQAVLERATGRYFVDRTFTTLSPWKLTTMLRAEVPLPGFRSITQLQFGGSIFNENESFWLIPDAQQTGVATGVQFRAFRAEPGQPWWYADSLWFDKALDSPFFPGNYGGGYYYTSMPNDLLIAGSAGYTADMMPFYTMRPASILTDSAITPQGSVLSYSQMPAEVRNFIAQYAGGQNQMVSVGG